MSQLWHVSFKKSAAKQYMALNEDLKAIVDLLVLEMKNIGPIRGNWKNYSKLGATNHHCHIKSGRPTYVICWEVLDKKNKIIEVYYVGTHEKAPY